MTAELTSSAIMRFIRPFRSQKMIILNVSEKSYTVLDLTHKQIFLAVLSGKSVFNVFFASIDAQHFCDFRKALINLND